MNRSTNDILTTRLHNGYASINQNTTMDCIFTDFSKAYDCIWHNGLIYKLYNDYKIDGQYLKCIIKVIKNRYTTIVTKTGFSTWKLQLQCLPQGSSLSLILYKLFTDDFKINHHQFIRMSCFAVDGAVWTIPSRVSFLKHKLLQNEQNRFID